MAGLFTGASIRGIQVKNRMVLPPMVCFGWAGADGIVSEKHLRHYRARAEGGAGILVFEATCILPDGRLSMDQLGLWNDLQIPGMRKIAEICRETGALALVQIHHAGWKSVPACASNAAGPSVNPDRPDESHAMTPDEIHGVRDAFISAAKRARDAGFHGVELHGAHGYLLSQFASPYDNRRTDEYGGTLENRYRLHVEIGCGIRAACGDDFILSIRIGCNEPDLAGGVAAAKYLESNGFDLLHVSASGHERNRPAVPEDFPYNWIVWGGAAVKRAVGIPVIVVNDIRSPGRAAWLIENGWADYAAIGKDWLVDARWGSKAESGEEILPCLHCRRGCKWFSVSDQCPKRTAESV